MTMACPCCGRPLPDSDEVTLDPSGIVVRWGRFAALTVHEYEILQTLRQNAPRIMTKEALLSAVYQLRQEEPELKIIDVWVCKLRKKLKPLGINIDTVWGRGYRMLPAVARSEAA
jgi:DNA-binding response OmpR family regulator